MSKIDGNKYNIEDVIKVQDEKENTWVGKLFFRLDHKEGDGIDILKGVCDDKDNIMCLVKYIDTHGLGASFKAVVEEWYKIEFSKVLKERNDEIIEALDSFNNHCIRKGIHWTKENFDNWNVMPPVKVNNK